ncbi:Uncharacterised protein [Vibrio cholerae]|nr:Uncharacterised protein [Vibrio cholerae]CSB86690.1 Uncharacterised protein [Vibrio cholerae]CSC52117.1 Uncharacterised protein [Vibrio cholerae]CSI63078.1 Uncharacterised protein [Vibrio cholerae]
MFQGFVDRFVSIWQFGVLTNHTDSHFTGWVRFFVNHLFPFREIRFWRVNAKTCTHQIIQPLRADQLWDLVDRIHVFH